MAIKSSRGVTSGKGTPQRLEGQNGDITIRTTPFGKKLFVKDANKWHAVNLDVNTSDLNNKINSLLKDVRSLKNSTRNRPVLDSAILRKPGAANIQLKNSSGALNIRNAADNGDVELSTTYTAAKCTDANADQTTAALKGVNAGTELTSLDMANDIIYISDANDSGDIKHTTAKVLTSAMAGSGLTSSAGVMAVSGIETTHIAAGTLVTESGVGEGISNNDNDTTIPTSAAVKDYVDNNAGGTFSGSITTNQIAHGSGTDALQGTDSFSFTNGLLSMETSDTSSQKPRLTFLNSNANDESGTIYFNNTSASPAMNDKLMQIYITGKNNAGTPEDITYATIKANILSFSDGSEASYMDFKTMASGSERTLLSLYGDAMLVQGTDGNTAFKIKSSADVSDFFGVTVDTHGATTIATVDDGATAANLTLDIDGDIELNADGGDIVFKDDSAPLATINSDGLTIRYDGSSHAVLNSVNGAGDFTISTVGNILGAAVVNTLTLKNGTSANSQYAVFGDGTDSVQLTTNSTTDIKINTNSGTNSGYLSIANGANGAISLVPNGTGTLTIGAGGPGASSGIIEIAGSTNGDIQITPNGTGDVILGSNSGNVQLASNQILDENGNVLLEVDADAGADNGLLMGNANTGGAPSLKAVGSDADINLDLAAKGKGKIFIDKNVSGDAADTGSGLHIDYDRTVASSGTANHSDTGIDVDVNSASLGTGYFRGIDIDVAGTSAGSSTTIGADITVTGADANIGLLINTPDTHIYMQASADAGNDYGTISVADTGDMTIATVGNGTTDSDITLDADGSILLDAASGNFVASKAGTEFSIANSAYAGMIIGYSSYFNTTATVSYNTITISTSMTVLETENNNKVNIVFTAPPSGNVEIELSCMAYGSSKEIMFSLSDAATYNELDQIHTYDDVGYKMDETDYDIVDTKFVVTGLTAGNSYQYWLAAKSSSNSAYIYHGKSRVNSHTHPIIVKAVALPGTITTGT
jgi:hypothetical protein